MADPIPTKGFHLWQIGLLLLIAGMIGWSAFLKPTTTNKADTIIQRFDKPDLSVPLGGCALWRFNVKATWDPWADKPKEVKK